MPKVDENTIKKSDTENHNKVKVDKYLTDIKELPPESKEEEKQKPPAKIENSEVQKKNDENQMDKEDTKKAI